MTENQRQIAKWEEKGNENTKKIRRKGKVNKKTVVKDSWDAVEEKAGEYLRPKARGNESWGCLRNRWKMRHDTHTTFKHAVRSGLGTIRRFQQKF